MTQASLDALKEAWPQRVTLRADEVALVLRGKQTRKVVERIRNRMKQGSFGDGARKIDGVWQLPLTDLAEVIEPTPVGVPGLPRQEGTHQRRKATIGPRVAFIRQARFWGAVLNAMGQTTDGQALLDEAQDILEDLQATRRHERAFDLNNLLKTQLKDRLDSKPPSPSKKSGGM